MLKTQGLIIACLALATGLGIGFLFATVFTFEIATVPPLAPVVTTTAQKQTEVFSALVSHLETKGVTSEGLSPYLLLEHFPTVAESDFDGVEAVIGHYQIVDTELTYKSGETVHDGAASDISEAGFALFLKNYSHRTGLDMTKPATEIVTYMVGTSDAASADTASSSDEFVACTMDAKLCSDGSYVGRVGPNCEFAACPHEPAAPKTITCTPEQKQAEACIEIYQPVCASVQIQCITTPCEPIPKTFGNSCEACSEASVAEYTEGACATE